MSGGVSAVLASHGGCAHSWKKREMPTLRTSIAGSFSMWFCSMEEVVRQGRGVEAREVSAGSDSAVCGIAQPVLSKTALTRKQQSF